MKMKNWKKVIYLLLSSDSAFFSVVKMSLHM